MLSMGSAAPARRALNSAAPARAACTTACDAGVSEPSGAASASRPMRTAGRAVSMTMSPDPDSDSGVPGAGSVVFAGGAAAAGGRAGVPAPPPPAGGRPADAAAAAAAVIEPPSSTRRADVPAYERSPVRSPSCTTYANTRVAVLLPDTYAAALAAAPRGGADWAAREAGAAAAAGAPPAPALAPAAVAAAASRTRCTVPLTVTGSENSTAISSLLPAV